MQDRTRTSTRSRHRRWLTRTPWRSPSGSSDPSRYDDPTVATPGQLDDIDEEVEGQGPQALIDA